MSARTYLVLDIETVPDQTLYEAPAPPPGGERPFPPLYDCRPIVIGVLWLDEHLACRRVGILGEGKDEAGLIGDFADFMNRYRPHLVTWNGRGFDLPVLTLRALGHGVSFPWYYRERDYRYRFTDEGHLDLCDALADHGACRPTALHGAARLIGLPGKDGVDGSQVETLYREGQMESLKRYCLSDVAQTAFVFLRYQLLVGQLDRTAYRALATELLAFLETDGRFSALIHGIDRAKLLLADG